MQTLVLNGRTGECTFWPGDPSSPGRPGRPPNPVDPGSPCGQRGYQLSLCYWLPLSLLVDNNSQHRFKNAYISLRMNINEKLRRLNEPSLRSSLDLWFTNQPQLPKQKFGTELNFEKLASVESPFLPVPRPLSLRWPPPLLEILGRPVG